MRYPVRRAFRRRPANEGARATGVTVRTWILAAMIALSALALATAGISAAELQSLRVDARIDSDLAADRDEFRLLAEEGVDPDTGVSFESPDNLVRAAMARMIPRRNQGVLGFSDGSLAYTTQNPTLALEDDPELMRELEPLVVLDTMTLKTITTPTTTYRVLVLPAVSENGSSVASLVLADDRNAEQREFSAVFVTYAGVALASLGIVAIVGWLLAGWLLRPIRVLAASARRMGREDLSERIPVTGNDDLADMTRAVNEMLERIEAAFAVQRHLLDDVSHELRTPLTVVRGHLELMNTEDAEEARAVRELVLGELDRMNRLVNDLMILATTDRPKFVEPGPTEIGRLTDDLFDMAVALGPRKWGVAARAEATVDVDAQRVTQAWLQLVANAVKFSEPDTAIAIGSKVDGGQLTVWVEDEGTGVSPEEIGRIFERFEQGTPRAQAGSGLGLAIVRAIAEAHGGRVTCVSVEGQGATFTIVLPLTSPGGSNPSQEEEA